MRSGAMCRGVALAAGVLGFLWLGGALAQEGAAPRPAVSAHAPLAADPASAVMPFGGALTIRSRIEARGLPMVPGDPPMLHSVGSGAEAAVYHRMLMDGVAWFREQLGYDGEMLLAVLDAHDYPYPVPWPTPFAEWASGLIVMPRHLDSHPGFDRWGLDAMTLNAALALHEAGHIISDQMGMRPALRWLDELVANSFMAAYLGVHHPELGPITAGVPPAFDDAGVLRRLIEFEALYFQMGQLNYAWFQFELARLAAFAVAQMPLPDLLEGIAGVFATHPQGASDWTAISGQIARLEALIPGIGAAIGPLGDVALPEAHPGACPDSFAPHPQGEVAILENRDPLQPLRYHRRGMVQLQIMIDALLDPGPLQTPDEAAIRAAVTAGRHTPEKVAPGAAVALRGGDHLYLEDGRCLLMPDLPAVRMVWAAN